MHEGPTENRLGELGSLYKYYYYYYYTKPTLTARRTTVPLILRSSCHRPLHTSSVLNASFNFSFSVALGKRRMCSSNKTFNLRCNELPHRLGYNLGLLNEKIPRVLRILRDGDNRRIRYHINILSSSQLCATVF